MLQKSWECNSDSLYTITDNHPTKLNRFIFTSPSSIQICNDTTLLGTQYTDALRKASTQMLKALSESGNLYGTESTTVVFNILRGGLNYELRGALSDALGWWRHGSVFISAQRQSDSKDPSIWSISESTYRKTELPPKADIICADVVATGTSLKHAFSVIRDAAVEQNATINSVTFVTIGAAKAEEVLGEIDAELREKFPEYAGTNLVYLEGRFTCATPEIKLAIKIDWTDLLRCQALLAPEFIESQYENPAFPLERCTIYDAGSRAYHLPEYFDDVNEYWHQMLSLAKNGSTFQAVLQERFPELDVERFNAPSLEAICNERLEKLESLQTYP